MGVIEMFSSCSCNETTSSTGNPDPSIFEILKAEQIGKYSMLLVFYPDCTNYEGKKILIYFDTTIEKLKQLNKLDPHFCDNSNHISPSPIARFVPTEQGWQMAYDFCVIQHTILRRDINE